MRKKITCWQRFNKETGEYEHNHIEDGWIRYELPTIRFMSQQQWKNYIWKKQYKYLENGVVV